jgi:BlaI family transcriptional regulator, penicillinase repressor
MARPAAKRLTERELEVMQVFWREGQITPQEARDSLATAGVDRAYTTVATLIRILTEKGFLKQTADQRPYRYAPARTYEEVSGRLLGDLIERVFDGSREKLLIGLIDQKELTAKERARLEEILRESRE